MSEKTIQYAEGSVIETDFQFQGAKGQTLAGLLGKPASGHHAVALFAHCFTCGKDIAAARHVSRRLAALGIAVLRFDFTGLGASEGEFGEEGFSANRNDLAAAAAALREAGLPPNLLIGHSLGGAAVLAAAKYIPDLSGVATIGAPSNPNHLLHIFRDSQEKIVAEGSGTVELAGREFNITSEFIADLEGHNMREAIANLGCSLLVLHAPLDSVVGIENAGEIFQAAKHPKSFYSLDRADHLLSRRVDAEHAAVIISAWAEHCLPKRAVPKQTPPPPEGIVRVEENTEGGKLSQVARAGKHRWMAGEPVPIGDDSGPTPYDLLLSGLGACTTMTLRLYATHKKLDLQHVAVNLSHGRRHDTDCEGCDEKPARIEEITRTVELTGNLTEAERARMIEIADKCPVHRTLSNAPVIKTEESR